MLDPGKYKVRPRHPEPAGDGMSPHPKWQVGEQEFEALMRMLDNLVRPWRPLFWFSHKNRIGGGNLVYITICKTCKSLVWAVLAPRSRTNQQPLECCVWIPQSKVMSLFILSIPPFPGLQDWLPVPLPSSA